MEELPQELKSSNADAYWRADQEGWGYAVMDYTDGQEFLDPKTRQLWKEAGDKLEELRSYLEQFKDEDF